MFVKFKLNLCILTEWGQYSYHRFLTQGTFLAEAYHYNTNSTAFLLATLLSDGTKFSLAPQASKHALSFELSIHQT